MVFKWLSRSGKRHGQNSNLISNYKDNETGDEIICKFYNKNFVRASFTTVASNNWEENRSHLGFEPKCNVRDVSPAVEVILPPKQLKTNKNPKMKSREVSKSLDDDEQRRVYEHFYSTQTKNAAKLIVGHKNYEANNTQYGYTPSKVPQQVVQNNVGKGTKRTKSHVIHLLNQQLISLQGQIQQLANKQKTNKSEQLGNSQQTENKNKTSKKQNETTYNIKFDNKLTENIPEEVCELSESNKPKRTLEPIQTSSTSKLNGNCKAYAQIIVKRVPLQAFRQNPVGCITSVFEKDTNPKQSIEHMKNIMKIQLENAESEPKTNNLKGNSLNKNLLSTFSLSTIIFPGDANTIKTTCTGTQTKDSLKDFKHKRLDILESRNPTSPQDENCFIRNNYFDIHSKNQSENSENKNLLPSFRSDTIILPLNLNSVKTTCHGIRKECHLKDTRSENSIDESPNTSDIGNENEYFRRPYINTQSKLRCGYSVNENLLPALKVDNIISSHDSNRTKTTCTGAQIKDSLKVTRNENSLGERPNTSNTEDKSFGIRKHYFNTHKLESEYTPCITNKYICQRANECNLIHNSTQTDEMKCLQNPTKYNSREPEISENISRLCESKCTMDAVNSLLQNKEDVKRFSDYEQYTINQTVDVNSSFTYEPFSSSNERDVGYVSKFQPMHKNCSYMENVYTKSHFPFSSKSTTRALNCVTQRPLNSIYTELSPPIIINQPAEPNIICNQFSRTEDFVPYFKPACGNRLDDEICARCKDRRYGSSVQSGAHFMQMCRPTEAYKKEINVGQFICKECSILKEDGYLKTMKHKDVCGNVYCNAGLKHNYPATKQTVQLTNENETGPVKCTSHWAVNSNDESNIMDSGFRATMQKELQRQNDYLSTVPQPQSKGKPMTVLNQPSKSYPYNAVARHRFIKEEQAIEAIKTELEVQQSEIRILKEACLRCVSSLENKLKIGQRNMLDKAAQGQRKSRLMQRNVVIGDGSQFSRDDISDDLYSRSGLSRKIQVYHTAPLGNDVIYCECSNILNKIRNNCMNGSCKGHEKLNPKLSTEARGKETILENIRKHSTERFTIQSNSVHCWSKLLSEESVSRIARESAEATRKHSRLCQFCAQKCNERVKQV